MSKIASKYIGRVFHRLTVIGYTPGRETPTERIFPQLICRCQCGNVKPIRAASITTGIVRSCGCIHNERARGLAVIYKTTHGKSSYPEYESWKGIKQRCLNPKNQAYSRYGGRGITICDRWINSFEHFYADLGPRPSLKHSLERIDNNKGYEPGNCKWATKGEQARNKRSNRWFTVDGITLCVSDWAVKHGLKRRTLEARLARGLTIQEALK